MYIYLFIPEKSQQCLYRFFLKKEKKPWNSNQGQKLRTFEITHAISLISLEIPCPTSTSCLIFFLE